MSHRAAHLLAALRILPHAVLLLPPSLLCPTQSSATTASMLRALLALAVAAVLAHAHPSAVPCASDANSTLVAGSVFMGLTAAASASVSLSFARADGSAATDYSAGETLSVLVGGVVGAALPPNAEVVLRASDGSGAFNSTASTPATTLTNKCDGQVATTCVCPPCCFDAAAGARAQAVAAAANRTAAHTFFVGTPASYAVQWTASSVQAAVDPVVFTLLWSGGPATYVALNVARLPLAADAISFKVES
jgi:hypothetical protein